MKLISDKESVDIIDFKIEDCLRNGIIKKYLLAKYQLIKDGIIKRKKRKEFEKEEQLKQISNNLKPFLAHNAQFQT